MTCERMPDSYMMRSHTHTHTHTHTRWAGTRTGSVCSGRSLKFTTVWSGSSQSVVEEARLHTHTDTHCRSWSGFKTVCRCFFVCFFSAHTSWRREGFFFVRCCSSCMVRSFFLSALERCAAVFRLKHLQRLDGVETTLCALSYTFKNVIFKA